MMDGDSDATLVLAARAGDKEAFASLYSRHRDVLLALCRRMLGDGITAQDAAHEAALQALLGLPTLREPARFGPWLCGIGLNVCRRWLRDRSHDRLLAAELPFVDGSGDPLDAAEAAEEAVRVRDAVSLLPTGQRAAVMLYYLSDLTYAETAAALGIEVSAVKTRLHKARATLRQRLSPMKEDAMDIDTTPETVDMRVIDVRRQPDEGGEPFRHVVVLEEVGGSRRLYIWVGKPEAQAIALQIEGADTPRPLTFRFAAGIIDALGARLREIRITRLAEEVFYAVAVLDGPAGEASVDARPSDAISLALAKGAPIRVASEVVNALQPETAPPVRDAEELEAEGIARAPQIVAEMQALWRR